jgi:thiamine biosynthesis protein ThiS
MEVTLIRDDLDQKKQKSVELDEGSSISDLLDNEGIERQEVLVSRNGTIISGQHSLEDGDKVEVFDVIAGG